MDTFISDLPVRMKIMGNAGILLILLACSSLYGIYAMSQIGSSLQSITEADIPLTAKLTNITEHQLQQALHLERALRFSGALQQDLVHFKEEMRRFDGINQKIEEEIREGVNLAGTLDDLSTEEQAEFTRIDAALKNIESKHADYAQHAQTVFAHLREGNIAAAEAMIKRVEAEGDRLDEELRSQLSVISTITAQASLHAEQQEQSALSTLITITVVALLIGFSLSWLITGNITRRLSQVSTGLKAIASGDLRQQGHGRDGRDEIGSLKASAQEMHSRLLEMIGHISETTEQLSAAAEEMSIVTVQTREGIQQQQSETEQVATAMNEMTATVQEVANNITLSAEAAETTYRDTDNGRQIIEGTIQDIQQLASRIEHGAETVQQLEQHSGEISGVLDVIRGVAEQTNLLALNAAIEAARAGEQGRGFAVVADEVRTLASRTQQSTEEINQMINNLQAVSQAAVQVMTESREQVQSVVTQATAADATFTEIRDAVAHINDMNGQIASAAEEQSCVAEEINRNIVQINDIAGETASGAEHTAIASQDLAHMATELQSIVRQFKV
ncbi:MAG TPA: methyl-accepting chemotaxis protein [Chromatiales bacterium]|nr:methyl-accepting chemotaxis protein [Chromatiales bacterium]HEX22618.1 methyl-accepting chemotaxis protein [Chromatiales bacterium]